MPSALFLSLGDDRVASSRVRVGSVLKVLTSRGWHCTRIEASSSLWPLKMLARLTGPRVVVIQKVVPPPWFVRILRLGASRLVFEMDDAIHLGYPGSPDERHETARRLSRVLPLMDEVVVSNALLANDLIDMGAREAKVFPGPAPVVRPRVGKPHASVIWLGSPSTFPYFAGVRDRLMSESDLSIVAVGAPFTCERGGVKMLQWSSEIEAIELSKATVGIMPVEKSPWSDRKAAYKVLEYLAADIVPVFAPSPATDLLLGSELGTLAVEVHGGLWGEAVRSASLKKVDSHWRESRDRVFSRWAPTRLAEIIVGGPL